MGEAAERGRLVVGVMTGTSLDGMDMAAARIEGRGLAMRATLLRHATFPLGGLGEDLRKAAGQHPLPAGEFARMALAFGRLHAEAIDATIAGIAEWIDLIAAHGQTIFHNPPVSWQLLNPAPIAHRFACPVVCNLRQADLAAGGQGAPITPLADWVLFRDRDHAQAIINLGGFCNVTVLPLGDDPHAMEHIRGFDVCACNQVLDAIARLALGVRYDEDGRFASVGRVDERAAAALHQRLSEQRSGGRSLGTGDEIAAWVRDCAAELRGPDAAASAVAALGRCIGEAIADSGCTRAILAGGGARNAALVRAITHAASVPVILSIERGVPVEAREALAMTILGALAADGVPISLPAVTGCHAPAPLAGSWTGLPGRACPIGDEAFTQRRQGAEQSTTESTAATERQ